MITSTTISHLSSIYYFNQTEYENNIILISKITDNILENKKEFINYYLNEGIYNNFGKVFLNKKDLLKEYEVSKRMLDYVYQQEKKEDKRKCK